ncbi:hypothetical protein [Gilvimarinus sp. 1_MG-2023]|uniref:hypothetical protein n=1 Tax=Gilvimarinus sp. 1_MG-2023 TaxID=3062638 RepID=UPI0026E12A44|nr:hypothetical protein [Gilvimarinus sp. 1_MG-2023]MDO6745739.1 hypothetical protein [Gilvimarinus sp. 1_MG-2023]
MKEVIRGSSNWLWKNNPVTRVVYARAPWEIKLIALSLMVLLAASMPWLYYRLLLADTAPPDTVYYCFSAGAVLAHLGFFVGLVSLVVEFYKSR